MTKSDDSDEKKTPWDRLDSHVQELKKAIGLQSTKGTEPELQKVDLNSPSATGSAAGPIGAPAKMSSQGMINPSQSAVASNYATFDQVVELKILLNEATANHNMLFADVKALEKALARTNKLLIAFGSIASGALTGIFLLV